jgi:hypothetical protein
MKGNVSIMGLDPGISTGVSILTVPIGSLTGDDPSQIIEKNYYELNGNLYSQIQTIAELASKLSSVSGFKPVVVYEEFDLDPAHYHSRDPELLAPVRFIGAIEYANSCNHFGYIGLTSQSRSLAKSAATDDRLVIWGLYTSGSEHIRDATRQSITLIRRLKTSPDLRRSMWGGAYDTVR